MFIVYVIYQYPDTMRGNAYQWGEETPDPSFYEYFDERSSWLMIPPDSWEC